MITDDDLQNWFTYHAPTDDQKVAYKNIREAGLAMARAINANTPANADQTAAIRKVREAVMTANAGLACSTGG